MVELLKGKKGQASPGPALPPASGSVSTSGEHWKTVLFLLIIIGLHVYDILNNFSRGGGFWSRWIIIYTIVAFGIAPFLLDEEGFVEAYTSKRVIGYVVVSALAVLLPYLIQLLGPKLLTALTKNVWFRFIMIISPVWGIYLMFTNEDDPWIALLRKAWVFLWIILFLATLLGVAKDLQAPVSVSAVGIDVDVKDTFSDMWYMSKTNLKGAIDRLRGIGPSLNSFVTRQLNDSIGYGYSSEVDDYSSADLGVQFVNIRALSSEFREGSDVVVWADIKGESFKDVITLNTRCYAKDDKGHLFNGSVTMQGQETTLAKIRMKETISMMCRLQNMPEGRYTVYFVGTFNFMTMAYIQYYFAPYELIQNLWMQDLDPAREAGIAARPMSQYTNGPVELGLASEIDQPIPIEAVNSSGSAVNNALAPFGASIINNWPDGEVASARYIKLYVPPEFYLTNCDTPDVNGEAKAPVGVSSEEHLGYLEYTFGNLDGSKLNYNFESVTCYLMLDPTQAETLISSYDLVMKTFGAKASYLYTIKADERIEVKKR